MITAQDLIKDDTWTIIQDICIRVVGGTARYKKAYLTKGNKICLSYNMHHTRTGTITTVKRYAPLNTPVELLNYQNPPNVDWQPWYAK